MKRKIFALGIVFILALSLMACKSNSKEPDKIKIGVALDTGGVNDGSFNESAWLGAKQAGEDFDVDCVYMECDNCAEYSPNLHTLIDEGCDLIVVIGYAQLDVLEQIVKMHPEQKFATVDFSLSTECPNVKEIMFCQEQSGYLVGYVAGLTTETDTVGFEIGTTTNIMNKFGYGYLAGVNDSNENAKVLQCNANSFTNTATGKNDATGMISRGADVIFAAAGSVGLGVFDSCAESGIKAIGVDVDQHALAEGTIITSAMKRVDVAVYDSIRELVEGKFSSGTTYYDVASGGVGIAPTTKYLEPDVLKKVKEVEEEMIAGKIVVPDNKKDFEEKYGDIYILD